jgi:hypothetical protein
MSGTSKKNRRKGRGKSFAISFVLVWAMLLQVVYPAIAWAEETMEAQSINPAAKVLDQEEIVKAQVASFHNVIIKPLDENDGWPYGDERFITISGETEDGSPYYKIIYDIYPERELVLPEGDYTIGANFYNLYGTVLEESMPNYYLIEKLNVTADTPVNQAVYMGGEDLALLTLNSTADANYIIPAISIFPEGQDKASIIYTQKPGEWIRKIRITPGTYVIVIALSDQTNTYFLEKQITIGQKESFTLTVDDEFTSSLTLDKSSYDKGERVKITQVIKDSYGNRLIGKAVDLPITYDGGEVTWTAEAPVLKIMNANNEEIYETTDLGNNRLILDRWSGWRPYQEDITLVEKLDTETTFYSGEYQIPVDIMEGTYTVKLDLGEGDYTHTKLLSASL